MKSSSKKQCSTNCRLLAIGQCAGKSGVQVYVTKKMEIYLVNPSNQDITVQPCELFGFNTGCFELKIAGPRAKSFELQVFPMIQFEHPTDSLCLSSFFARIKIDYGNYCSAVGVALANNAIIPWLLKHDSDLVVSTADDSKSILSVAELICQEAKHAGIMEVSIADYSLDQLIDVSRLN